MVKGQGEAEERKQASQKLQASQGGLFGRGSVFLCVAFW